MRRSLLLLLSLAALGLASARPGTAQPPAAIHVLRSSAQANYPGSIDFSLEVSGGEKITDVTLNYWTEAKACARVISRATPDFSPAQELSVKWTWDMRKTGGLPPGVAVWYYWEVSDTSGATARTDPAKLTLSDDRFRWQSLTEGMITLYWHFGDNSFGRTLLDAATAGLQKLRDDTGADLERPVNVWVYAGSTELQGALIFPQEWTGAVAYSSYSTIMAGIASGNLTWGRHALPHELSHLIVSQVTFNCYGDTPTWLDEGLAEYAPGGSLSGAALSSAVGEDAVFTVRSLSSAFPAESDAAMLSYAESESIVTFLIDQYGRDKMSALLASFRDGRTYDDALRLVYGFDQDGLDAAWRKSVGLEPRAPVQPTPTPEPIPTLVPVGASAVAQVHRSDGASWPPLAGLGVVGFAGSAGLLGWKRRRGR